MLEPKERILGRNLTLLILFLPYLANGGEIFCPGSHDHSPCTHSFPGSLASSETGHSEAAAAWAPVWHEWSVALKCSVQIQEETRSWLSADCFLIRRSHDLTSPHPRPQAVITVLRPADLAPPRPSQVQSEVPWTRDVPAGVVCVLSCPGWRAKMERLAGSGMAQLSSRCQQFSFSFDFPLGDECD